MENNNKNLKDNLEFLKNMLLCTNNIYTWEYSQDMLLMSTNCPYAEFWGNYFSQSSCKNSITDSMHAQDAPMILTDSFNLMWISMPYRQEATFTLYLLGPILMGSISYSKTADEFIKRGYSVSQKPSIISYLKELPIITITIILQYCVMLYYTITEKKCIFSDIIMESSDSIISSDMIEPSGQTQDSSSYNEYGFECFYLKLVEDGNLNYQTLLGNYESLGHIGTVSLGTPLHQAKSLCSVNVSLCSRAAIRGGLNPDTAYNLTRCAT